MGSGKGLVLVTGAAGFIGSHVSRRLLDRGDTVLGLDNLNDYYDVRLKEARLAELDRELVRTAAAEYVADVRSGSFPSEAESFAADPADTGSVVLYAAGAAVAIDSVRAMSLRTAVWLGLFLGQPRKPDAP